VDYERLFAAIPTPYLVMTPELVILDANPAYLAVTGRSREDIVGRGVFEAFPPQPDALDEGGVSRVQRSFERARDTGVMDTMPVQKYDIPDSAGGFVERYWSLISVPVLDDEGRTVLVVQRTEDITDYVRERERRHSDAEQSQELRRRTEEAEADLYARSRELEEALRARDRVGRRLAALAEVSFELSNTQTVEELTAVVVDRGVAVLGADGGAVAVLRGDTLELVITDGLGETARAGYARLPLDGPLPGSVSARTGETILLPDRETALAFDPGMADVLRDTGCSAWACLPLVAVARSSARSASAGGRTTCSPPPSGRSSTR
jgi:PAS domain S-box-containing protein